MDPAICNDFASSTDAVVIPSLSDVNDSTEDPEVDVTGFHQSSPEVFDFDQWQPQDKKRPAKDPAEPCSSNTKESKKSQEKVTRLQERG